MIQVCEKTKKLHTKKLQTTSSTKISRSGVSCCSCTSVTRDAQCGKKKQNNENSDPVSDTYVESHMNIILILIFVLPQLHQGVICCTFKEKKMYFFI